MSELKIYVASWLRFATDIEKTVQRGTVQFIAVGTPSDEDSSTDLHYVLTALYPTP